MEVYVVNRTWPTRNTQTMNLWIIQSIGPCGFWIHNSQRSAQYFIRVVIIRIEEFLLTFFFSKIIVSFRIKNKLISVKLKSVTNDSNLKKVRVMTTTSSWLHYQSTVPRPAWRTLQNHKWDSEAFTMKIEELII